MNKPQIITRVFKNSVYDSQLDGSVLMAFLTSREVHTSGKLLIISFVTQQR